MDPELSVVPKRRKEDRPSGRLRKGLYILPSLFTAANMAMGYYAILQVTHATVTEPWHFDFASKAIGFAVLFDGWMAALPALRIPAAILAENWIRWLTSSLLAWLRRCWRGLGDSGNCQYFWDRAN